MTIDELHGKLENLLSSFPDSEYNAVTDSAIADLGSFASAAAQLGMGEGKKLIENLSTVLKACKEGSSTDASVSIRLTALDFYVKKLQNGSTEEL